MKGICLTCSWSPEGSGVSPKVYPSDRFTKDEVLQLAMMRLVQNIGEAARVVSRGYKAAHPEIPWLHIVGMRNRLVHEYFRIDIEKLWKAIEIDVPNLERLLKPLVPPPDEWTS